MSSTALPKQRLLSLGVSNEITFSEQKKLLWATKNNYSNSIRLEYNRVEHIWEGISGDGLEGTFWEEGLTSGIQSKLEYLHGLSVHYLLWQFAPVRGCMLATTGFTPLLVNLESMTSKLSAFGGSKDCVAWKVEKAVHYFVHAHKVTTDTSTD